MAKGHQPPRDRQSRRIETGNGVILEGATDYWQRPGGTEPIITIGIHNLAETLRDRFGLRDGKRIVLRVTVEEIED